MANFKFNKKWNDSREEMKKANLLYNAAIDLDS